MITFRGRKVHINYASMTPQQIINAERWAKGAATRVLTPWTSEELSAMRITNYRVKKENSTNAKKANRIQQHQIAA